MNKQDEALLDEIAASVGTYLHGNLAARIIKRLRELVPLAPAEPPLADGYYWVREGEDEPFILKREKGEWPGNATCDHLVLGPVAPWNGPERCPICGHLCASKDELFTMHRCPHRFQGPYG